MTIKVLHLQGKNTGIKFCLDYTGTMCNLVHKLPLSTLVTSFLVSPSLYLQKVSQKGNKQPWVSVSGCACWNIRLCVGETNKITGCIVGIRTHRSELMVPEFPSWWIYRNEIEIQDLLWKWFFLEPNFFFFFNFWKRVNINATGCIRDKGRSWREYIIRLSVLYERLKTLKLNSWEKKLFFIMN